MIFYTGHPVFSIADHGFSTEWHSGLYAREVKKSSSLTVSPVSNFGVTLPNGAIRVGSFSQRFHNGAYTTLANMPPVTMNTFPGVSNYNTQFAGTAHWGYAVDKDIRDNKSLYVNMQQPYYSPAENPPPVRNYWADSNYCKWIIPTIAKPTVNVVGWPGPTLANKYFCSNTASCWWLYNKSMVQGSWYASVYAVYLFKDWRSIDIESYFTTTTSMRRAGFAFLRSLAQTDYPDTGELTDTILVDIYPSVLNLRKPEGNGDVYPLLPFTRWNKIAYESYNNHLYQIVLASRGYIMQGSNARATRISTPWFNTYYINDAISWPSQSSTVGEAYDNIWLLETGSEYLLLPDS